MARSLGHGIHSKSRAVWIMNFSLCLLRIQLQRSESGFAGSRSKQTGSHRCLPDAPRGARAAGRPGWLHTPAEARIRQRSARRVCETGERHMGRPAFTWRRRCTSLGPLCHAPRLRRCSSREAALFVAAQPPPSSETRVRRARAAHHAMHVPAVATRSGASHALLDDGGLAP